MDEIVIENILCRFVGYKSRAAIKKITVWYFIGTKYDGWHLNGARVHICVFKIQYYSNLASFINYLA